MTLDYYYHHYYFHLLRILLLYLVTKLTEMKLGENLLTEN